MSQSTTNAQFLLSPPNDGDAFRRLARAWAASVTVVCARRREETIGTHSPRLDGFTATAFLTVSAEPPIVLISASNGTSALSILSDAKAFTVNLLARDQREISNVFSTPHERRGDPFSRFAWTPDADETPYLHGTLGVFSARIRELHTAGDHTLCLGDVTAIRTTDSTHSLLYQNRMYGGFDPDRLANARFAHSR
jgi:flavin reductase (DIM6/NTAB) family NADH-FMN oxidoreductase RutF